MLSNKLINKSLGKLRHQEMKFLPNPIDEWDRDKYFMINLLDVILDKLAWIENKYPLDGLQI